MNITARARLGQARGASGPPSSDDGHRHGHDGPGDGTATDVVTDGLPSVKFLVADVAW